MTIHSQSYAHAGTTVRITDVSIHSPLYANAEAVLNKKLLLTEEPIEVFYPESIHGKWFNVEGYIGMDRIKIEGIRYAV